MVFSHARRNELFQVFGSQLYDIMFFCKLVKNKSFLVATGVDLNFKYGLENEVIDLKHANSKCESFISSDNLTITSGAVGGIINGSPVICGGRNLNGYAEQNCTIFRKEGNTNFEMFEKRVAASSVVLNQTTLWIVGGIDPTASMHNSTEFITGESSVKGPSLPFFIKNHCMVKINETAIYIIGGVLNISLNDTAWIKRLSNKTWIINPEKDFQMTEGPELTVPRSGHSCGKFRTNGKFIIVVAGGYVSPIWLDSVEFLDMSSSIGWKLGKVELLGELKTSIE